MLRDEIITQTILLGAGTVNLYENGGGAGSSMYSVVLNNKIEFEKL